jgi:hypothetical protein
MDAEHGNGETMTKRIILDTDIDTDCDDAGALAILHALMDSGECDLLGVVCSIPVSTCTDVVATLNAAYGRGQIPLATMQAPDFPHGRRWSTYREHRSRFTLGEFGIRPYHDALLATGRHANTHAEPAVPFYRRLLAQSPDNSVTICAIGTLTALAPLLASGADDHSPLNGVELVRSKVAELVSMALVEFPQGQDEFNWRMDIASAALLVQMWPGVMTISAHGGDVLTGARFMAAAPLDHPLRAAYLSCLGDEARNRPSWDLLAALYAVRGNAGPFDVSGDYGLLLDPLSGQHRWHDARPGTPPRRYVTPTVPDQELATLLEDLMIRSLRGTLRTAD